MPEKKIAEEEEEAAERTRAQEAEEKSGGSKKEKGKPDARRKAAKDSRPRSKRAERRGSKGRSDKDKDRTQAKKSLVNLKWLSKLSRPQRAPTAPPAVKLRAARAWRVDSLFLLARHTNAIRAWVVYSTYPYNMCGNAGGDGRQAMDAQVWDPRVTRPKAA